MKPKITKAKKGGAFGDLLSKGIWGVCEHLGRFVHRVEADLLKEVEALGYEVSPSTINYWRRGRAPADARIVELIVRYCLKNNPYLELRWATDFLDAAGYSVQQRAALLDKLFPPQTPLAPVTERLAVSALQQYDQSTSSFTILLPRRPKVILGRDELIRQLRLVLTAGESVVVALTGMPGIGKTALAVECVYQLAEEPATRLRYPDGLFFFSCLDQHGHIGLLTVAKQVLTTISRTEIPLDMPSDQWLVHQLKITLAHKRALLILDAVPADFPVAQALELLYSRQGGEHSDYARCDILLTSCTATLPGLIDKQIVVDQLPANIATDLLARLLVRSFSEEEEQVTQHLCAIVGSNPLALEWIAQAASLGLSLTFLEEFLSTAVDSLLGEEHQLHGRFRKAIADLPVELQNRFARLAELGTAPFTVVEAAPLMVWPELTWDAHEELEQILAGEPGSVLETLLREKLPPSVSGAALHATSAGLLRLASNSIVTPVHALTSNAQRFQMPPLFHTVAADLARRQFQDAITLAECYQENIPQIHQSQVLTALAYAWAGADMEHVLELASSLYWAVAWLPEPAGERILRWGIRASQELNDTYYLIRFLTRLAKLRFYRGDMGFAEKVWEESVELAQPQLRHATTERVSKLLMPLSNLTLIPGVQQAYLPAIASVNRYIRISETIGASDQVAHAHMKLAFYLRLSQKLDKAVKSVELSTALAQSMGEGPLHQAERDLEMARVAGDFERASHLFDRLVQEVRDPMPRADYLYDQAVFARNQHRLQEAQRYAQQSLKVAQLIAAPVVAANSLALLQQLQPG